MFVPCYQYPTGQPQESPIMASVEPLAETLVSVSEVLWWHELLTRDINDNLLEFLPHAIIKRGNMTSNMSAFIFQMNVLIDLWVITVA